MAFLALPDPLLELFLDFFFGEDDEDAPPRTKTAELRAANADVLVGLETAAIVQLLHEHNATISNACFRPILKVIRYEKPPSLTVD
jgi:hypothetical protein